MGHHHGHPLTGAMELRPDHWSTTLGISPKDPKDLRTNTNQTFLINQTDLACIHTNIYTYTSHTISHNSPLSYSQPNHANSLFSNPEYGALSHTITMPHWYQPFHISCRTYTKLIISISWIISYNYHAHLMLKLINHNSYTTSFTKAIQFINLKEYSYKHVVHFWNQGKHQFQPPSRPASRSGRRVSPRRGGPSLRRAPFALARARLPVWEPCARSRLGETLLD